MADNGIVSLKPLGAGDLIDRAVRFYRRFFWTFIAIAAAPVVPGALISLIWTFAVRQLFVIGVDKYSSENILYNLFLWFGSAMIWLIESVATLVVMGGASRNFVRHLLFGEPITFSATYRNVLGRLAGLTAASSLIVFLLWLLAAGVFYLALFVVFALIWAIASVFEFLPILVFVFSVAAGIAVFTAAIWLFFLIASRVAYVPQVMLVEGQGVFSAVARSANLAGRKAGRLAALFVFTTAATYSALALLYVPLAWYASANGVQLMSFDADAIPAWYEIAYNLIWQLSIIVLSPVWMIGLCLLYVDERVRTEGYDLELLAAANLGDIPAVPPTYVNPLHPAISKTNSAAQADLR